GIAEYENEGLRRDAADEVAGGEADVPRQGGRDRDRQLRQAPAIASNTIPPTASPSCRRSSSPSVLRDRYTPAIQVAAAAAPNTTTRPRVPIPDTAPRVAGAAGESQVRVASSSASVRAIEASTTAYSATSTTYVASDSMSLA